MSRTYKAIGINLKSMPLGENDRLLTILTREFGLIRAVAPGARKYNSKLGGRSGLFVVNDLLIAQGRSLDKITQAETLESYPGLGKDLGKLAASQYLAELVLCQALSDQPQEELYDLLNEHLRRLEQLPSKTGERSSGSLVLAHLSHGIFHLLALAGIAPQVHACCLTHQPLMPDFTDVDWRIGFSLEAGGTVSLFAKDAKVVGITPAPLLIKRSGLLAQKPSPVDISEQSNISTQTRPTVNTKLNATELMLLQQLAGAELNHLDTVLSDGQLDLYPSANSSWLSVERILRQYTQYHLGRSIRSADLMDACLSC
jgi:DNA repair protein RecO (recombination protein O)